MLATRRFTLTLVAAGSFALAARIVAAEDARKAERAVGNPEAKTTIGEYFSLTCTHCAAFAVTTMPDIHRQLIESGKVRWVYHDFPLDQVALTAAMVARYLPVDRYEPFINALFASQDRWAFNRAANTTEELWKTAALAGMSRDTFDKAIADTDLRTWILQQQQDAQKQWNIDSTPSFVVNGKKYSGEMSFDAFSKLVPGV